jgi:hypothetical protein
VQGLVGLGLIVGLGGSVELRIGGHAGITDAAPDLVGSTWIAGKLPLP